MVGPRFSFLLGVFMLFTVGAFLVGLEAQDTEENSMALQEFVKKAQEHVKQNEIDEAIELYKRIVTAEPEDNESRLQLAKLFSRTKQYENASQTYRKLLETHPDNIEYQDELVNNTQAAGKHNEALDIAQVYIKTHPKVGVHYARLARLNEADGNETEAIENYKKATIYGYGDRNIYLRLAEHCFLNDDIAAAEEALNNAMIYTTSSWDQEKIERQLVNLYLYQGNLEEKLQIAETEGTLTFEMQIQRARLSYNSGELDKAADAFIKALRMTNSTYKRNEISIELLNTYLKQNRTDLALDFSLSEISKQIQSKGVSTFFSSSGISVKFGGDDTRKTLIDAYKNQGKLEELRTNFEGQLEKDIDNPLVLEMLAEIYWNTNDYQKAAEKYHLIGKTEPMGRKKIRSFYHAAAAFHKSNQPDMVKAVLNQAEAELATRNNENDASFLGALATICLDNEMYDNALILVQKAVTHPDGWDTYLYELLARTYLAVKRYEDAFETYQQMAKMAIKDDHGSMQRRAENGMSKAAKAGDLYEKWIPEQLKQVKENPNDLKHILNLIQSYEATNKIREAVDYYEILTDLVPEKAHWYKKLGNLYQNLPQESRETGTLSEKLNPKQLDRSLAAYEKAIEIDPTSYELYSLLAEIYIKSAQISQAEETYRRALDAPLTQYEHDAVILAVIKLYTDEGQAQENKQIAFLEEFKTKMSKSDALHELLGDLYKEVGDVEKAELAYTKWLKIRMKALNSTQSAHIYRDFVNILLEKDLYPEVALKYAKRAFQKSTDLYYVYPATLGHACIANGLYDEALKHFKHALSLISDEHYSDMFWEEIAGAIKNAKDKERYVQLLENLKDSIPNESSYARANIYRIIAEYYGENGKPEKAENYLLKTGFIPETVWITLGQFENKDSVALFTSYIPEDTTQIDTTAAYYGKDKLIRWKKPDDGKVNGMIWLGSDIDWTATYAWAIVSSPDERNITIRFDSDDQGTVRLNGQEVFRHDRMSEAQVDRYTIPVTLQQGENTILVKVCNAFTHTYFFMRLTDTDGNPQKDLKFKNAEELLNAPPPKPTFHVNVNLGLAEYYSKINMPDKAMEQMRETGTLHENAWLVLGPYDNTAGIGYNTKYIPEDTPEIDRTVKYDGVDGQISWKKHTDDAFDGFIDLGEDINWRVSYAMATVTSQEEREVLFRFSSDDQSKIWLNTTEVFADANPQSAVLDKYTIPVTLKAGKNTILVKVCNEEMSWGFYLRVTDAVGKPFEDVKIDEVQDNYSEH